LLTQIASLGNGKYSFIPDAGLVGTVFINSLSNLLSTFATDVDVIIEKADSFQIEKNFGTVGGFSPVQNSEGDTVIHLGALQCGQEKNLVLQYSSQLGIKGLAKVKAKIQFTPVGQKQPIKSSYKDIQFCSDGQGLTDLRVQCFRMDFITCLLKVLQNGPKIQESLVLVQQLGSKIRSSKESEVPFIVDLLKDLEGQVTEALSKKEWFDKWGVHYLPSLLGAHLHQQCNNFKDPGVQHYGGKLFATLRDEIDEIFLKIPPPKPSFSYGQPVAPVNMANYNDVSYG